MSKGHMDSMRRILPELRGVSLVSGGFAAYWTFMLLLPVDLFARNGLYFGLSLIAPKLVWAAFTGLIAIAQLAGWWTGIPRIRTGSSCYAALLWAVIAMGMERAIPLIYVIAIGAGPGLYILLAVANLLVAIKLAPILAAAGRLRVEQQREDDLKRRSQSSFYGLSKHVV